MTRLLAVDPTNDIYIAFDGNLAINTGLFAVLQACAHAVKAQLGEMVLQTQNGIPNFQLVWRGAPNLLQFESYIRTAILQVDGVLEIVSLTASVASDAVTYQATIRTVYGLGDVNG